MTAAAPLDMGLAGDSSVSYDGDGRVTTCGDRSWDGRILRGDEINDRPEVGELGMHERLATFGSSAQG